MHLPVSILRKRQLATEKSVLMLVLVAVFLVYLLVIFLSSWGDQRWSIDQVGHLSIFSVDDAYRYFISRGAFLHLGYYSWSYTLPVSLLLNGLLSFVTGHVLAIIRLIHAIFYLVALYCLGLQLFQLLDSKRLAVISVALLAFFPCSFFVSMSFYAEAWMLLFVIWILCAYLQEKDSQLLIASALCVLVRPEGVFFLLMAEIYFLYKRDFVKMMLLIVPVSLYFVWVMFSVGLTAYWQWRQYFMEIQNGIFAGNTFVNNIVNIFNLYSPVFVLPVFFAVFNRKLNRLWFPTVAAVIWVIFWFMNVVQGKGNFEPRYYVCLMPVLIVLWALGVESLVLWGQRYLPHWSVKGTVSLLVLATFLVFLLQSRPIKLFAEKAVKGQWLTSSYFYVTDRHFVKEKNRLLNFIYAQVNARHLPQVDALLVATNFTQLFYYLDPERLPSDVKVYFVPSGPDFYHFDNGVDVYGMTGQANYFKVFNFGSTALARQKALYIGYMKGATPHYFGDIPVFLWSYHKSLHE